MTDQETLQLALTYMGSMVQRVEETDLSKPTPDTDWSVRDLLRHIIGEVLWIPDVIAGQTIAEVGDRYEGDVVGASAVASWQAASNKAEVAIRELDDASKLVHLSFGDVPAHIYLRQMILDLTIHAWDLATAIGQDDNLPEPLVEAAWDVLEPEVENWRSAGALAAAVTVSDDAPLQTKLLALSGRQH